MGTGDDLIGPDTDSPGRIRGGAVALERRLGLRAPRRRLATWAARPIGSPAHGSRSGHGAARFGGRLALRVALITAGLAIVAAGLGALAHQADLPCARPGLINLEVAGSSVRANAVLHGCRADQVRHALAWDLPFIAAYVIALAAGAFLFGRLGYRVRSFRRRAVTFAIVAALVGLLDLLEDAFLLWGLHGSTRAAMGSWQAVAAASASWPKWLLAAVVVAYIGGGIVGTVTMPGWVRKLLRDHERAAARPDPPSSPPLRTAGPEPTDGVGISLSGGGVRSASFSLGVLQSLDDSELGWPRAKAVSAVSGGSYMAGAFALARSPIQDEPARFSELRDAAPGPWRPSSPEESHLQANLGYILAGNGGAPGTVSMVIGGFAVNVAGFLLVLWLIAQPVGRLASSCAIAPQITRAAQRCHPIPLVGGVRRFGFPDYLWKPILPWAVLAGAFLVVWLIAGRITSTNIRPVSGLGRLLSSHLGPAVCWALGVTLAMTLTLLVLPWALTAIPNLFDAPTQAPAASTTTTPAAGAATTAKATTPSPAQATPRILQLLSAAGLTASVVALIRKGVSKRITRLGGVFLALFALLVGGQWAASAAAQAGRFSWRNYLIVLAVTAALFVFVNPEWWSLAPGYRARLRRAYATWRPRSDLALRYANTSTDLVVPMTQAAEDPERPKGYPAEPSIYELGDDDPGRGPQTLICATMNVSGRSALIHHGIPAFRMTFSSDQVEYYRPLPGNDADRVACRPWQLEALSYRWDSGRLTPMTAVGMSGAAVSSAMGRASLGNTDAILAFANVRLGVWIPNPRYAEAVQGTDRHRPERSAWFPNYPRVRLTYLFKELLGLYDPDDLYVYVTDGGHWENTGLTDLVRPQEATPSPLAELVCVDASGVSIESVTSLAEAIGLARLECHTDIRIRFDALRARGGTGSGANYATRCATIGIVVYQGDGFSPSGVREPPLGYGVLWYAKPVLTEDDPTSLLAYAERDRTYPAVGTIDQFFDEEHFVGYRDLGRHAGANLLDARTALTDILQRRLSHSDLAAPNQSWVAAELHELLAEEEWPAFVSSVQTSFGVEP